MSHHHEYRDDQYNDDRREHKAYEAPFTSLHRLGRGGKHRSKLFKYALIAVGIAALLAVGLIIGLVVLFVHFLSVPATGIFEALTEAWRSVLDWLSPVTDLYNRTINLIPGSQE